MRINIIKISWEDKKKTLVGGGGLSLLPKSTDFAGRWSSFIFFAVLVLGGDADDVRNKQRSACCCMTSDENERPQTGQVTSILLFIVI